MTNTVAQDTIIGGGVINGDNRNNRLVGGDGDDLMNGNEGNDSLFGGNGIDTMFGGAGHDLVQGDKGDDRMSGDAGNDRLIWNNGDGSDILEGGSGNDVAEVNDAALDGDSFVLQQRSDRAFFQRVNLGRFSLNANDIEKFEINATGGDDQLVVKDLSQTDVQSVFFQGGQGNDILDASLTNTPIQAFGGRQNDLLQGGEGIDTLHGEDGNDTIFGGGSNDILTGGNDDDVIDGEKGNDRMFGDAGNDRLIWNNGDGSDLLEGGTGYDVAEVNDAPLDGDSFVLQQRGDRASFRRVNLGRFTLNADGIEKFEINATGGDDQLVVKDLSQTDVQSVFFQGGQGNDFLDARRTSTPIEALGDRGDDILFGGSGNDTLIGGDGNDLIIGGGGNNVLVGGNSRDLFGFDTDRSFNSQDIGRNQIQDFSKGNDKIVLDLTTFNSLDSVVGQGFSVGSEFAVVNNQSQAANSEALIVYISGSKSLVYNQNGSAGGYGQGGEFASFTSINGNLAAQDFVINA